MTESGGPRGSGDAKYDRKRCPGRPRTSEGMTLYESVADLPLEIDSCSFEPHERETSSDFTRVTTEIALGGDGEVGKGEDVTYDAEDQYGLEELEFGLTGSYTLDEFSDGAIETRPVPGRTVTGGLPALPPVGLRERGARPRASAGGYGPRVPPRPYARTGSVRREYAVGRPAERRPGARLARYRPRDRVQTRRHAGVGRRTRLGISRDGAGPHRGHESGVRRSRGRSISERGTVRARSGHVTGRRHRGPRVHRRNSGRTRFRERSACRGTHRLRASKASNRARSNPDG